MRLIDADKLKEYPIRIDHYDKKNGSKQFVYGVESVLEYADYLPTVEAIPIEWIYEWRWNNSDVCCDKHVSELFGKMVKDWKKENETN